MNKGIRSFRTSVSKREEIIQERPNNATWDIWRQFLHHHFIHTNRDIKIPLGCWLIDSNSMQRLWVFYYSKHYDQLYRGYRLRWHQNTKYNYEAFSRIVNTEYFSYTTNKSSATPPNDATSRHTPNDMLSKLPFDAVPCDINDTKSGWAICDHYPYEPPEPSPIPTPTTLQEAIALHPTSIY